MTYKIEEDIPTLYICSCKYETVKMFKYKSICCSKCKRIVLPASILKQKKFLKNYIIKEGTVIRK